MRLWSYQLLDCLDDFHIQAQWRELLAIKGAIDKNGTPNHRLVNKVLDFPIEHFKCYADAIVVQMGKRKIKFSESRWNEITFWNCDKFSKNNNTSPIYQGWHNDKYFRQCYYNLEEKHDCGIVSDSAWEKIEKRYNEIFSWEKEQDIADYECIKAEHEKELHEQAKKIVKDFKEMLINDGFEIEDWEDEIDEILEKYGGDK